MRNPTSLARAAVLIFVACAAAAAASVWAAEAPDPATLLTWEHEDIAFFREHFLTADRSYTAAARAQAKMRLARLEHSTTPLGPIQFAVALCRIAALADNGHTVCLPAPNARAVCRAYAVLDGGNSPGCIVHTPDFNVPAFNSVALKFFPFGEDFNVVGTHGGDSELLGARLISVDGKAIGSIRALLRSFAGGIPAYRDVHAADVLASPDQLYAVGISREANAVTYRFLTPTGHIVERQFRASPEVENENAWETIPRPEHAPWAFQQQEQPFRWRDAPELDAVIVQLRQNVDAEKQKIAEFLERAEANRERLGRRNVVLDMRFNGGGNLLQTRDFMASWPSRVPPPGRFFVLMSPLTFSAAISSIAYLKQAGQARVVLVGTAPGDRLMFFSEGRPIELPHSGLFFRPSEARHDYHTACRGYDDCFLAIAQPGSRAAPLGVKLPKGFVIERRPVAIRSLDPDISAPWTVDSWLKGTDPAMTAVARALGKESTAPG